MSIPSYPFYFLPLKLSNKEMDFSFPLLKLPNKGRMNILKLLSSFISIPSSQIRAKDQVWKRLTEWEEKFRSKVG